MAKKRFSRGLGKLGRATLALAVLAIASGNSSATLAYATGDSKVITTEVVQEIQRNFTDVGEYWATESIYWAVNRGLVKGYEDNTYRPDNQITEEEFATVLARYVSNIDTESLERIEGARWSQHIYNALAQYQLPLKGYTKDDVKSTGMTRGTVAQIIAAKYGFNLTEKQAVYFMYENDLSNGLIEGTRTFESYGADLPINREQVPAFFKRLDNAGIISFKGVNSPYGNDEMGGIVGQDLSQTEVNFDEFNNQGQDQSQSVATKTDLVILTSATGIQTEGNPHRLSLGETINGTPIEDPVVAYAEEEGDNGRNRIAIFAGIVTPYSVNFTKSGANGVVILTALSPKTKPDGTPTGFGFWDKDLFLKIIKENWTFLSDEQYKLIEEHADKVRQEEIGIKGIGGWKEEKCLNGKYDLYVNGNTSGHLNVMIYEKGTGE